MELKKISSSASLLRIWEAGESPFARHDNAEANVCVKLTEHFGLDRNSLHPACASGFELDGKTLRLQGLNRIGNMVVPNENYVLFEQWLMPILDTMLDEQINDVGCLALSASCQAPRCLSLPASA